MALPIEFEFCIDETMRCHGRDSINMSDREGEYFGNVVVKEMRWAIVLWDNDEDPVLYKADCLLLEKKTWVPLG